MIDTYHRFTDYTAFCALMKDLDWEAVNTASVTDREHCTIAAIGTLYDAHMQPLPGYHVNVRWHHDMHDAFKASQLTPNPANPRVVWA